MTKIITVITMNIVAAGAVLLYSNLSFQYVQGEDYDLAGEYYDRQ